jgi:hypothetical protein
MRSVKMKYQLTKFGKIRSVKLNNALWKIYNPLRSMKNRLSING